MATGKLLESLDKGKSGRCQQHAPIVAQYAIGHDTETNVITAMIALKTICMSCGLVQNIPQTAYDEPDEA